MLKIFQSIFIHILLNTFILEIYSKIHHQLILKFNGTVKDKNNFILEFINRQILDQILMKSTIAIILII